MQEINDKLEQYQILGQKTVADLFDIKKALSKEFYTKGEVQEIMDQYEVQNEEVSQIETSEVQEPVDISGALQYNAAQAVFSTIAYGMEFSTFEKIENYLLENKQQIETIQKFFKKRNIKKISFNVFWKLLKYLNFEIDLRQITNLQKNKEEQKEKEYLEANLDPYLKQFTKHLFKNYSDSLFIEGQKINQILIDYGINEKLSDRNNYNYQAFQQFMIQRGYINTILEKKEKELLVVLFDSFNKNGLIATSIIQRCADIEGLDRDMVQQKLQQFSQLNATFEEFYQIMKKSGWQAAW